MQRWIPPLIFTAMLVACPRLTAQTPPLAGDSTPEAILQRRLADALDLTRRRYLRAGVHTPWQVFHGIIAFGTEFSIRPPSSDELVNAVEFMCTDARVSGRRLLVPTRYGLEPIEGTAMEGHPDQFLAILAQSGVPIDFPVLVDGQQYRVEHLVTQAQSDYTTGQEASWTLIALATYLPPDARWSNRYGSAVEIEDLVAAEVGVEPVTAACGGTHNLYALAYGLNRQLAAGRSLTAPWQRAAQKIDTYISYTRSLQNADGHFSSRYYEGRGRARDFAHRIETTGHTLEWLSLALSDEELEQGWVTRGVEALLDAFEATRSVPLDCGALYHGAHALALYRDRRFGPAPNDQGDVPIVSEPAPPLPAAAE
ncbi:MAG: hypothetical protein ACOC46_02190 [Pirellulales bacterium]